MAILSKGTTFAVNDQVTATKLNNLVDAATFDSTGAVDNSTTQISGGAIIVKDGGITPQKLDTAGVYTVASITATSGISTDILSGELLKLVPETGYATAGTIPLNLSVASNAVISLTNNATFTISGQASGTICIFALKNGTGAPVTTAWPAWQAAGGSFPASLTAGQAMIVTLYCYGTTSGDVYAVSSI